MSTMGCYIREQVEFLFDPEDHSTAEDNPFDKSNTDNYLGQQPLESSHDNQEVVTPESPGETVIQEIEPEVIADIDSCVNYDLAIEYVNVVPTTTNRYTACDAQLALNNSSSEPALIVWHLIYDNDPAKGPEEVWKSQRLEPGEAIILVDDLFTSKWNNGEYYYRKVLEIASVHYTPECEQFYINLTYHEPPSWFTDVAKPVEEFTCP